MRGLLPKILLRALSGAEYSYTGETKHTTHRDKPPAIQPASVRPGKLGCGHLNKSLWPPNSRACWGFRCCMQLVTQALRTIQMQWPSVPEDMASLVP
jgi:hypothetical protein